MLKIHLSDNIMLKDKQQPVFEDKWPNMRPTILKLLRQARFVHAIQSELTIYQKTGSCEQSRMARPLLVGALCVPLGWQGPAQGVQRPPRGHPRVHQTSSGAGPLAPGGAGATESLHSRVAEVFHTMQLPTHAFWPAGDGTAGQNKRTSFKEDLQRWISGSQADARLVEPEHLLQHQTEAAGLGHEAGSCREDRGGFRQSTGELLWVFLILFRIFRWSEWESLMWTCLPTRRINCRFDKTQEFWPKIKISKYTVLIFRSIETTSSALISKPQKPSTEFRLQTTWKKMGFRQVEELSNECYKKVYTHNMLAWSMMDKRKYKSKHSGVHEVRRHEASGGGTEGNEVPGELLRQI